MQNPGNSKKKSLDRRSFLKKGLVASGATAAGIGLLSNPSSIFAKDQEHQEKANSGITQGDAAILRFLAAAEILETDLWKQYNELGGIQDSELPDGSGNPQYTAALEQLDSDMPQYIHDNTENELTHEEFFNSYLMSKGAEPANLDNFRRLQGSKATGASNSPRLTNLMQLTVETSWWTRYRSRTKNPDFGDTFENAVPSIGVGQHPAIPRDDNDVQPDSSKPKNISDFTQVIANTAGFHFAFIEQGGTSLYPQLAQRVTSPEVLRILLSIGGTEICHFQTWHDKAGNAPPLNNVADPKHPSVMVTFPDLSNGGEDLQKNLILPEPTVFLSKDLKPCSIIRPTNTQGAAMAALHALTNDGLFIGQGQDFMQFMATLAEAADEAARG
jgi:hypothetical protein